MKTLKVALLVTTAAGAVAAGGVTYATVGNSSPATPAPAKDAAVAKHLPAVKPPAVPNAPAVPSVPTCVPNLPKGEALTAAKAKIKQQIETLAAKAPQTPVTLPALPGKLPKTLPAEKLAKLPVSKLPTCKADEQKSQSATEPTVPGAPALPTAVSCDKVPAVIKNEQARAKQITLPNGATLGVAHAHSIVIQSRAACVYTQQFVGALPGSITVDRIKTPPQVTLAELAQELKMPGQFVKVSSGNAWQTPTHDGMLWLDDSGYAVRLTSSNPATAALLPGLASQLHA